MKVTGLCTLETQGLGPVSQAYYIGEYFLKNTHHGKKSQDKLTLSYWLFICLHMTAVSTVSIKESLFY